MPWKFKIIGLGAFLGLMCSCSTQPEEEVEPDYESMVMQDEEFEGLEWIPEGDRDRKVIAQELPDPDELVIIEPFDQDHGASDGPP